MSLRANSYSDFICRLATYDKRALENTDVTQLITANPEWHQKIVHVLVEERKNDWPNALKWIDWSLSWIKFDEESHRLWQLSHTVDKYAAGQFVSYAQEQEFFERIPLEFRTPEVIEVIQYLQNGVVIGRNCWESTKSTALENFAKTLRLIPPNEIADCLLKTFPFVKQINKPVDRMHLISAVLKLLVLIKPENRTPEIINILTSLLEKKSHYEVKKAFEHMPQEEISDGFVKAVALKTNLETLVSIAAIIPVLPKEHQTDPIIKELVDLFKGTEERSFEVYYLPIADTIRSILNDITPENRTKEVICSILAIVKDFGTKSYCSNKILLAFKDIPPNDQVDIITKASTAVKDISDLWDRTLALESIIKILKEIPSQERSDIMEKATTLVKDIKDPKERIKPLTNLLNACKGTTKEDREFIMKKLDKWSSVSFFDSRAKLFEGFLLVYKTIPADDRIDVVENASVLFKNIYSSECVNIFKSISLLPKQHRKDVVDLVAYLLKYTSDAEVYTAIIEGIAKREQIAAYASTLKDKPKHIAADQFRTKLMSTPDEHGLRLIDYCVIPPFQKLKNIPLFHPDPNSIPRPVKTLIQAAENRSHDLYTNLWGRICERYPNILHDTFKEKNAPDLLLFVQFVSASTNDSNINSLFEWDFKMNQSLPLNLDTLRRIQPHCRNTLFRVALQTCTNYEEAFSILEIKEPVDPFITKEQFFELPIQKQRTLMCRAQLLRQRNALGHANRVVKEAVATGKYDKELLLHSLKLYQQTEIEASPKLIERLTKLIEKKTTEAEVKIHAALALSEIDPDPISSERKAFFVAQLNKPTIITNQQLRKAFLESLEKYEYTQSPEDCAIAESLIKLAKKVTNQDVQISLAMLLSLIPNEKALEKALKIVNGPSWDSIEGKKTLEENLAIQGSYTIYTYRPRFHDSRSNMKYVIAERYMQMHRDRVQKEVSLRYRAFMEDENFDPVLKAIRDNIRGIAWHSRHIPFSLFLPPNKVSYRGVCGRKQDLADGVVIDTLAKGMGSADLSRLKSYDDATWAKVGQVFSSATLDYVLGGFFDKDGMLATIKGEYLNEMHLRRSMRLQHEGSLHFVCYKKVKLHAIKKFLISSERQSELQEKPLKKLPTIEKVMQRNLAKSEREKFVYFNPNEQFEAEVKNLLRTSEQEEVTTDELIEENVKRRIAIQYLAEITQNEQLRACLAFAASSKV